MESEEIRRISRSLYGITSSIIGSDTVIHIRRTITRLRDDVWNVMAQLGGMPILCYSGSKAEGMRFKSSDEDWMVVGRTIKVIPSNAYSTLYDSNTALLLIENRMTKPGFVLLRFTKNTSTNYLEKAKQFILNAYYISSKLWRESHAGSFPILDESCIHGPCLSGIMDKNEYDFAFCLKCDVLPQNAYGFVKRLHHCSWPSHNTILNIINDGVLFVPIGAKQSYFEDTEWRMSFSLAEKKLIYAMNHTQFLCYGLLKIFLKEAIDVNVEIKGLLCSYFLKTAVFWEIVSSPTDWNPSSLMSKFWNCFLRLLQWISCSHCPNFFIPENNMFEGKIEGTNRDKLLNHLNVLYQEGFISLLRCPSLFNLALAIDTPTLEMLAPQGSNSVYAKHIIVENFKTFNFILREDTTGHAPLALHQLASSANDSFESFIIMDWFKRVFCKYIVHRSTLHHEQTGYNKMNYEILNKSRLILNKCRTDSVSHYLYKAMVIYSFRKYALVVKLVQLAKDKTLQQKSHRFMNACTMTDDKYRDAGGDILSIETMQRKYFIDDITIESDTCIPELYIEIHGSQGFRPITAYIPSLVFALFLQYLCYSNLGLNHQKSEVLDELHRVVQHGDGQHIYWLYKAMSWQILGLCQQMAGNDQAACHSYLMVLQDTIDQDKVAACIRLGTLLVKYI